MCDKTPLVSIIVPVYNVEKFLNKCVESILKQTYQNIEVILVDDGSTDNCPFICDKYKKEDSRISVIHKENEGLSDARNVGIKNATGEYFYFIDSDDFIVEDTIQCMLNVAISVDADITIAGYKSIDEDYNQEISGKNYGKLELSPIDAIKFFTNQDWGAWGKLYKRSIHENVFFPVGKIHEDEAIMYQLICNCKKICTIPYQPYYYVQRKGSITATKYSEKKDGLVLCME